MIQPMVSSHIDVHLIEKALALWGKTMEDMEWLFYTTPSDDNQKYLLDCDDHYKYFSIQKFWWYLLSPEFIEKYYESQRPWYTPDQATLDLMSWEFGYAIYEYQSGNSEPLVYLLSKI